MGHVWDRERRRYGVGSHSCRSAHRNARRCCLPSLSETSQSRRRLSNSSPALASTVTETCPASVSIMHPRSLCEGVLGVSRFTRCSTIPSSRTGFLKARWEFKAPWISWGRPERELRCDSQETAISHADLVRRQCRYGSARPARQMAVPKQALTRRVIWPPHRVVPVAMLVYRRSRRQRQRVSGR